MKIRSLLIVFATGCALVSGGCKSGQVSTTPSPTSKSTPVPGQPSALPETAFKASITLVDAPAKLRAGQKQTIQVKVKNVSDVMWYARGAEINTNPDNKFYLAVGNRWLHAADEKLVTNMDGRYGLPRNLKPGEDTEVPLLITAPKDPGEYILDVDLVQEQVAWFSDKGSATAKTKVSVVK